MSEIKKLTDEELQSLRNIKAEYDNLALVLGDLEIQKLRTFEAQKVVFEKEENLAKALTEKYGKGVINIETGEIS